MTLSPRRKLSKTVYGPVHSGCHRDSRRAFKLTSLSAGLLTGPPPVRPRALSLTATMANEEVGVWVRVVGAGDAARVTVKSTGDLPDVRKHARLHKQTAVGSCQWDLDDLHRRACVGSRPEDSAEPAQPGDPIEGDQPVATLFERKGQTGKVNLNSTPHFIERVDPGALPVHVCELRLRRPLLRQAQACAKRNNGRGGSPRSRVCVDPIAPPFPSHLRCGLATLAPRPCCASAPSDSSTGAGLLAGEEVTVLRACVCASSCSCRLPGPSACMVVHHVALLMIPSAGAA